MANQNFPNSRIYTGHVMPVMIDCNFIVDSTNGNGLGIRSLKGAYVQSVYMHTSSTPATGSPNPAAGTIVVRLSPNFNRLLTGFHSFVSPLGSTLKVDASDAALTVGVAYVIAILGDATAADWLALGVSAGQTPAVGLTFIAAATGAGTASVTRVAPTAAAGSGLFSIETVGDSNQAIAPKRSSQQTYGSQIILQCRTYSSGSAIAAPADGTVISLAFLLSNSSILVAGE